MGAETVVKKIQEKAVAECEAIRSAYDAKAAETRKEIIGDARAKAENIIKAAEAKASLNAMRAEQQATLEGRIGVLDHKHKLLNGIRDEVLEKMKGFDAQKKLSLYTKFVSENPVTGNVSVKVPACDAAIYADGKVLEAWSKLISEKTGKKTVMTLDSENADIEGGLILCGEIFDIDLSYEAILDDMFESSLCSIADKLFGKGV